MYFMYTTRQHLLSLRRLLSGSVPVIAFPPPPGGPVRLIAAMLSGSVAPADADCTLIAVVVVIARDYCND
jgi:hypothetical protein